MTIQNTKVAMCEGRYIFFRTLTILLGFLPPGCCVTASDTPSSAHSLIVRWFRHDIETLSILQCTGQRFLVHQA